MMLEFLALSWLCKSSKGKERSTTLRRLSNIGEGQINPKGGCNMCVYVKNQRNEPLMPTTQRKARILLKQKKAKIVCYEPFTIQLLYATG